MLMNPQKHNIYSLENRQHAFQRSHALILIPHTHIIFYLFSNIQPSMHRCPELYNYNRQNLLHMSFYLNCSLVCTLCHGGLSGKNISIQIYKHLHEGHLILKSLHVASISLPTQRRQPSCWSRLGRLFFPSVVSYMHAFRILIFSCVSFLPCQ